MFSMKNGDQQSTNVKNTRPSTLVAFCSVATALADRLLRLERLLRKLYTEYELYIYVCSTISRGSTPPTATYRKLSVGVATRLSAILKGRSLAWRRSSLWPVWLVVDVGDVVVTCSSGWLPPPPTPPPPAPWWLCMVAILMRLELALALALPTALVQLVVAAVAPAPPAPPPMPPPPAPFPFPFVA